MYINVVKRIKDFSEEDFKKDCLDKNINYEECKYFSNTWKIQQQDIMLGELTNKYKFYNVRVSGIIEINHKPHEIIPKILGFDLAMDKILTPDLYDFEIYFDDVCDEFTVFAYHDETNINNFVLKLV